MWKLSMTLTLLDSKYSEAYSNLWVYPNATDMFNFKPYGYAHFPLTEWANEACIKVSIEELPFSRGPFNLLRSACYRLKIPLMVGIVWFEVACWQNSAYKNLRSNPIVKYQELYIHICTPSNAKLEQSKKWQYSAPGPVFSLALILRNFQF